MMRDAQHIVFDWNGTLLDDLHQCLSSFNAVSRLLGVEEFGVERYQEHYVIPFIRLYEQAGCDTETLVAREKEIHEIFHKTYDEAAKTTQLRDGAEEILGALRKNGVRTIILSNHTVSDIDAQARRLGVRDFFDVILANDRNGVAFKKGGKDQRLKDYLEQNNLAGGLIVGDSPEETEIGHQMGLVSVAICGGMCSEKRLRQAKPHYVINTLHEMKPILQERGLIS